MDKAPDAFRTISEVADHLDTPAHVLRFWESRFPQIRPVKRAGGRRYYRPADVALLTGIKRLLHDEGLTIRGVQKILREQGVRHVAGLSGDALSDDLDMTADAALEAAMAANFGGMAPPVVEPARAESATIVALETALRRSDPAPAVPQIPGPDMPETYPWQTGQAAVVADLFAEVSGTASTRPAPPDDQSSNPIPAPGATDLISKGDLAAALRGLPAGAFGSHADRAHLLQARLLALHNRLSSPPQFDNL